MTWSSYTQISDFKTIDFTQSDSIAMSLHDESLYNLPELSYKLTAHLDTDVEKFRAIYMWICTNIKADYGLYARNKRKRNKLHNDSIKLQQWNDHLKKITFQKLLKDKKTICTGYAYLLQELSQLSGITCKIVHGYGRTSTINVDRISAPNHSWNAVELNGKWYLSDPTWASGLENPTSENLRYDYINGFFLVDPKFFAINHFPIEHQWSLLPLENAPSFKSFLEAPVIYGKAYRNLSYHSAPEKLHNTILKNEKVAFKYQLLEPAASKDISLLIDDGSFSKKIHPELSHLDNHWFEFEYRFSTVGFYDVHLYVGEDLVSTYTFDVKQ
ncbi:transglutaminase domain-containing protein [Psychroserpens sp. BH13MA-6]